MRFDYKIQQNLELDSNEIFDPQYKKMPVNIKKTPKKSTVKKEQTK